LFSIFLSSPTRLTYEVDTPLETTLHLNIQFSSKPFKEVYPKIDKMGNPVGPGMFKAALAETPREALNWRLAFSVICFGLMVQPSRTLRILVLIVCLREPLEV
jgi:hypothetical protein